MDQHQQQQQQQQTTATETGYKYQIDQESLDTVFGNVVSGIGGRKFVCDSKEPADRITSLMESLLASTPVTGCKLYNNTLLADKTFDETQKTIVVSSFVNLLFLGLNKSDARKVVLSHQMRDRLIELFTTVSMKFGCTSVKVLTFKNIDEKVYTPGFVEKNKKDFVYIKVVMKMPNVLAVVPAVVPAVAPAVVPADVVVESVPVTEPMTVVDAAINVIQDLVI